MKPSEQDIAWARAYGWDWNGEAFVPEVTIKVIPNPVGPGGWTPWAIALGALQMDAPFGSPRAALRAAEALRLNRRLRDDEMNCGTEAPK